MKNMSKEARKELYFTDYGATVSMGNPVSNNDPVTLVGFGTFKTANRKARKGRNPQTGKEINIAEKNVPKFVPGKALKDAVK